MKRLKKLVALICAMSLMAFPSFAEAAGTKVTSVRLNKSALYLSPGDSVELTATTTPSSLPKGAVIYWTIGKADLGFRSPYAGSNTTPVKLSSTKGKRIAVTANNHPSTLTIKCLVCGKGGNPIYAKTECSVRVSPILVENIYLSDYSIVLNKGRSHRIGKTVSPSNAVNAKNLRWSSTDTFVATVSQTGHVTARRGGKCYIYCATTKGKKVSEKCLVTVRVPVRRVQISGGTTVRKGQSMQLRYHLSPSDATAEGVTWSSSCPRVATVSRHGLVSANSVGRTVITCKAQDSSGKVGKKVVYVRPAIFGR